ncbi:ATP-binding protein [Pigmentiphaga humi]|nr:ATP-binding protein [Pigmentiphaga humi]
MSRTETSFLRTLSSLRWLAIGGQAATIFIAGGLLNVDLHASMLWAGVGTLILFNLYAGWHLRAGGEPSHATAVGHMLVDIVVLAWMIAWSGGIGNPFGLLFLVLIALAAMALPRHWAYATAAAGVTGYGAAAIFGQPLKAPGDAYQLLLLGIVSSFLITVVVILIFSTRLAADLRHRERELADLSERFARNEGIVALATHAASMAHELNTPLATMTLLADEIAEQADTDDLKADTQVLTELLALCRERVRNLAVPSEVELERVVEQWTLVRPTVELHRTGILPKGLRVEPSVAHLLQALLNNAADAGEQAGAPYVDLHLECKNGMVSGMVRDYGHGFNPDQPLLPATLFRSAKPGGLGVGLALSHATVERLRGEMTMTPASGGGVRIQFHLPVETTVTSTAR